ncbi:hypothetical protein [Polyangium sp. y55x31]|nr:hypothetical protein [Polyangium sp. y55x31]MDI1479370.1 hypothetical protein [Polyangium sp. y55x31]
MTDAEILERLVTIRAKLDLLGDEAQAGLLDDPMFDDDEDEDEPETVEG